MSPDTDTDKSRNGAFISTRDIYNQVNVLQMEVAQLKTLVKMISLIVTPIVSTALAAVVTGILRS